MPYGLMSPARILHFSDKEGAAQQPPRRPHVPYRTEDAVAGTPALFRKSPYPSNGRETHCPPYTKESTAACSPSADAKRMLLTLPP